jgi:hypothetical protein
MVPLTGPLLYRTSAEADAESNRHHAAAAQEHRILFFHGAPF